MSGSSDPAMLAKEMLEEVIIQRDEAIKRAIDLEAELNETKLKLERTQEALLNKLYEQEND